MKRWKKAPESRTYVHLVCDAKTVVSGDVLDWLSNPLRPVFVTYCQECERNALLGQFEWDDTGESLSEYRRRLRRRVPLPVKLWAWLLGPASGGLVRCLLGYAITSDPGGLYVGLIMGVVFWLACMNSWTVRKFWGLDFRKFR